MGGIAQGLTFIIQKIVGALTWIGKLFVACFVALWDMFRDAVAWVLDEFMQLAVSALGAIDTSAVQNASAAWGTLPGEILNILGLLGIGYCFGIIATAIAIRLALQLIPFTRLGS